MRRRHSKEERNTVKTMKLGNEFCGRLLNRDRGGGTVFLSAGGEDAGVIEVWNDEIPENSWSAVEGQKAISETYFCSKTCMSWRLHLHMRTGKYLNWYFSDLLHIELDQLDYLLTVHLFDKCWCKRIKKSYSRFPIHSTKFFQLLSWPKGYSWKWSCSRVPLQMAENPATHG